MNIIRTKRKGNSNKLKLKGNTTNVPIKNNLVNGSTPLPLVNISTNGTIGEDIFIATGTNSSSSEKPTIGVTSSTINENPTDSAALFILNMHPDLGDPKEHLGKRNKCISISL